MDCSLCPWGFSKQEYWCRLPCPPPGDLPNPGIKPRSLTLWADSLPSEPPGKPKNTGVGSLFFLQGIFTTQESNQGRLHCRWILYQLSSWGSPCRILDLPYLQKSSPAHSFHWYVLRLLFSFSSWYFLSDVGMFYLIIYDLSSPLESKFHKGRNILCLFCPGFIANVTTVLITKNMLNN